MAHTGAMTIQRGTILEATTASGSTVLVRALDKPIRGRDFPVVWVCTPEEWDRAVLTAEEPDGLPWPLNAVMEPQPV